ncbi:hypothetical protein RFI_21673 [Reticulomyxa filosa]|uniref:Phospholipase/carboxylesterase/thioesterase domain-containing protein n=1 Tax=Reticulomyxa filosa TaxID=46433 RepID=X6MRF8_RETFI|nr:hypothetical protein RFI_21673 [Reticulomyxa filosa]|eukprot:ETO15695.1 hypothetical protein RFI_21673 [Reticulomyxa filosa]
MDKKTEVSRFDPNVNQVSIPMMMSLHGFGNTGKDEQKRWEEQSNEFVFILITPNGQNNSWSALQCCGMDNEKENSTDLALVTEVIRDVTVKLSRREQRIFPYLNMSTLAKISVFLAGWNNGAFLTDYYAWNYVASQSPIRLTGVITLGGYIFNGPDVASNAQRDTRRNALISISMHHSYFGQSKKKKNVLN